MTRPLLNRRLAGLGTTIFAEMSALAVATGSINLGQGFPDTDGPAEIARAAADAVLAGRGNQYPPGPGVPELRQAIAAHQKRFYGLTVDPDTEVLVTAGATEAIAAALLALLEPGDEVIAFEPYYDSYAACIAMAGATRVPVTLRPPEFRPGPGRAARRGDQPDPADPAELAAQPDRHGAHPRRADGHRRARHRAGPARRDRRGLRAHRLRGRAHPDRDPAGHAGPDRHDQLGGQDVLLHRLEGGLGDRDAGAWSARSAPPSSSSRSSARDHSSTRSRPGSACPTAFYAGLAERPGRQARPAGRRAGCGRLRGLPAARDVLHHHRHRPPWATGTAWPSAGACPAGPASSPFPTSCSTTPPRRPGAARCASRSASARKSWPRRPAGSPGPPGRPDSRAADPGRRLRQPGRDAPAGHDSTAGLVIAT